MKKRRKQYSAGAIIWIKMCIRDSNTSLGDWQVNEQKLTGGLKRLVDQVNEIGLKFGIWFEPEMISPCLLYTAEVRDVEDDRAQPFRTEIQMKIVDDMPLRVAVVKVV